jgi:transposase
MAALETYYQDNQHLLTGKQRINAKTAWKAIRDSYAVGESTVRRYVREMKGQNPQGFIPLSFEPGEVMQVDWNEVKVNIGGHLWKAPVFCAVLPYSYGIFAMVMPNMQMPCFIEAHTEAFKFFGGTPKRVFYDNLRTAVYSGAGKNAVKQERFRMLEAHYAFEAVFMNAGSGHEKGSVENLCSLIRQVAFVPIPKGKNLHEIQEQVLRRCLDYIRFHKVRDRRRGIASMLEEERSRLMPLPLKAFSAYAEAEAVVGSDLTFRYDTTKYSVPQEYIGKTITVRATSYQIEAWHRGVLVCAHERPFVRGEHQYLPEHYLPLLEKRPRAIPNAAPLKYGVLPPELDKFRSLNKAKDKYEQLANVLLLGRQIDAEILLQAVHYANRTGSPSFDTVCFYLQAHRLSDISKLPESDEPSSCAKPSPRSLSFANSQSKDGAAPADAIVVDSPRLNEYDVLFAKGGEQDE